MSLASDILRAGTGFMLMPTEAIKVLAKLGYDKNLVACFDHFELDDGHGSLFPKDFLVDEIIRFENSSDPDDQSVLYAISTMDRKTKGIYLESYGLYHEEFSRGMIRRLGEHLH